MHQMGSGMGDGYAAVVGRPQHFELRRQVVRLGAGGFNVIDQLAQTNQRCVIAHRIRDGGGKALDQVAQGVDPGRRGDVRRHAGGQFRQQRHVIGQQYRGDNADFGALLGYGEDRVRRGFGASTGAGGNQ